MTSLCGADGAQEAGKADADGDSIVFLYKLKAGACPKSYGLQVRILPIFHRQSCYKHKDMPPICHYGVSCWRPACQWHSLPTLVHCECLAGMQACS